MPAKLLRALLLLLLFLLAGACGKAKPAPAHPRVHPNQSPPLRIEVTALPAGFTAVPGAVDPLRFTRADGSAITVARGTGADLPAAARAEGRRLAGWPGGRSLGSVELLCQFGRAYLTRGRYLDKDSAEKEEIRIFFQPEAGRPLVLAYVYPAAGARRERLDQALAVLRSIQKLP